MSQVTIERNVEEDLRFWRTALAGIKQPIADGKPQCGYYRRRAKPNGPLIAVAIWRSEETGDLLCRSGDEMVDPNVIWMASCRNPVTEEAAMQWFETGTWPSDIDMPGSNGSPREDLDEHALLASTIDMVSKQAVDWLSSIGTIATQDDADKAQNFRAELQSLEKKADAARETEKRPFLEKCQEIQSKWKPLIEAANTSANRMRLAIAAFLNAERAKREEAAIASIKAGARGEPGAAARMPDLNVKAGTEKPARLRTVTRGEIVDFEKALTFFKDADEIKETLDRLVQRAVKAGVTIPGVEVRKIREVV